MGTSMHAYIVFNHGNSPVSVLAEISVNSDHWKQKNHKIK